MAADYRPVVGADLPGHFVFQPDGQLRDRIARARDMGVVRVIAGPVAAHLIIDIKRPYFRGLPVPEATQ